MSTRITSVNFRSDNETPVAPKIWKAMEDSNLGTAWAYGEDDWSMRLDEAYSELFETPTRVMPLTTGTVANAIALACSTPPWGSVFCHRNAHIVADESGAPEFYGNGLRLSLVDGEEGKIQADGLRAAIDASAGHGVHSYSPAALSLTQTTESGAIYQLDELKELYGIANELGLATHMDGARFANAIAALGCTPAECTWKAGAKMLSFGAAKNGCMTAVALLFFGDTDWYETAERHRKRGGHLVSKMRYISAQLLAYIEDGLWLDLASHANQQAQRLAKAIESHGSASLEFPVHANHVFVRWTAKNLAQLESSGVQFQYWPGKDDLARFVFAHSTTDEEMDFLIRAFGS